MKYSIFFLLLCGTLTYVMAEYTHPIRFILAWPAINLLSLAVIYMTNKPRWLTGKSATGRFTWYLALLNLPWLVFTWTLWLIQAKLSNEPAVHNLKGTNIDMARWPLLGPGTEEYDVIIDLAVELPRWYATGDASYEALANLDGVPLRVWRPGNRLNHTDRILVHCAQGHGRTASFCCLLLARLGYTANFEDAEKRILASRPLARLASTQRRHVSRELPHEIGS